MSHFSSRLVLATFLDHTLGRGAQSGDPIVRQEFFEQNEAIVEVALAPASG
jgi:hypothetical protein